MLALMHPEIEFRGMTPGRTWATVVWGIEIGYGALVMAYFLILAASTAAATRST